MVSAGDFTVSVPTLGISGMSKHREPLYHGLVRQPINPKPIHMSVSGLSQCQQSTPPSVRSSKLQAAPFPTKPAVFCEPQSPTERGQPCA